MFNLENAAVGHFKMILQTRPSISQNFPNSSSLKKNKFVQRTMKILDENLRMEVVSK